MTAPLNRHIQNNLIEMVQERLLLERITLNGVDVNIRDEAGYNALYWAITRQSTHNAKLLISFGSSLMVGNNLHALFYAIQCNYHEFVVLLFQKGLSLDIKDDFGKTALMYAIEEGLFNTAKYLIDNGANIDLADCNNDTAIEYATRCNSWAIESYLNAIKCKALTSCQH